MIKKTVSVTDMPACAQGRPTSHSARASATGIEIINAV